MSVMLSDREAKAAEKLIDSRVQEMDGDRILAIALGEVRDEEFEAMAKLRRALRGEDRGSTPAKHTPRRPVDGQRSVAIGRHAYDYLTSHDSLEKRVRDTIRASTARKTLVGLTVPDPESARQIADALRTGAANAEDSLTKARLESAAARVERLAA